MLNKSKISRLIPNKIKTFFNILVRMCRINNIFFKKYGYLNSIKSKLPVDTNGRPIPWYTYPAIEFINQFDYSEKYIFEYGSGNSSLYWGDRAKKIISVESNKDWYNKVINEIKNNKNEVILIEDEYDYPRAIENFGRKFDIIIIDSADRDKCCEVAPNFLAENGLIILDNSERHQSSCKYLRDLNFIEIDFFGFGPINDYTWSTSIFFKEKYFLMPIKDRPIYPIGNCNE